MKLSLSTRSLARQLEVHDAITSTNHRAKELAQANAPEGLCVLAHAQTRGRGQRNRKWVSPAGVGLYASFLTRPEIHPQHTPMLTLATAVAVHEAITEVSGIKSGIKWPNDILDTHSLKKFAGILVEVSSSSDRLAYAVIGIGINLKHAPFPESLQSYATSLEALGAKTVALPELLSAIANRLEPKLDTIGTGRSDLILDAWRERALGIGQEVELIEDGVSRRGKLLGVNAQGALLIDGQAFYFGELRLLGAPTRPSTNS